MEIVSIIIGIAVTFISIPCLFLSISGSAEMSETIEINGIQYDTTWRLFALPCLHLVGGILLILHGFNV